MNSITNQNSTPSTPYPLIPAKQVGILRVVSINVNGLRASAKKGLLDFLAKSDFDVVCLQETRINTDQWTDALKISGWHCVLFPAEKAGYAGTAIYSRLPFMACAGLGFTLADNEGRFLCGKFNLQALGWQKPLFIASLYLPSGSSGDDAQARKDLFLQEFFPQLQAWRNENRSIIICGDYNIVHTRQDIKNWAGNQKASGCLPHERAWLDKLYYTLGFVDSFRQVRQDSNVYSWWSNRGQARAKNVGWRIDYHAAAPDIGRRAVGAWVYREQWFSDHAPVVVDYALT